MDVPQPHSFCQNSCSNLCISTSAMKYLILAGYEEVAPRGIGDFCNQQGAEEPAVVDKCSWSRLYPVRGKSIW
ncbi:uncharacterized protein SETTUDRAFT_165117 [Exserohilum turcica Et28A]|uniref:Uncharacterized protein n=1 Tax=Exserohilum turcicum (strain 28A) TaxID=671987 RepID=R0IBS3_EXST2|nr:uncharacterized protein SETTUDRAFT_165117 [Exserohilum turcica Et28A]EOA82661.1 hypothetical protein SETTUDRAFT_165117 [Exserohilum turcica Et28A]